MLDRSNKILSLILKAVALFVIACIAIWIGVSVYANFAMKHNNPQTVTVIPEFPKDARIAVLIKATGQTLLTNSETDRGKIHILHGYYELVNRKWVYRNANITLDEKYYGPITPVTIGR